MVIFLGPFYAKGAPKGFFWVGIGGLLIGLGGIALAFISVGKQLLFFSPEFVMLILTPLLFLMAGAFALGFAKKGIIIRLSEVLQDFRSLTFVIICLLSKTCSLICDIFQIG